MIGLRAPAAKGERLREAGAPLRLPAPGGGPVTLASGAMAAFLPDGRRLHLQHGPIDLILGAEGAPPAVQAAFARALCRFDGLLQELVADLPLLRTPVSPEAIPAGPVARRMTRACLPLAQALPGVFLTPMAAVAGAVADEILAAMRTGAPLDKIHANNGGDAAFHLAPGAQMRLMMAGEAGDGLGQVRLRAGDGIGGVATSGRGGRSFSLGIAEAVTVLAATAAEADAAATLIANAVDLPGHPAISRGPACAEQPDSDLGDLPVVLDVGPLSAEEAGRALAMGLARAEDLRARGLIAAAALTLEGQTRVCGAKALTPAAQGERDG